MSQVLTSKQQFFAGIARYISDTFGRGFSVANLWNFRQFYLAFPSVDKLATRCVANLSGLYTRLLMRLESSDERIYYLREASSQNWSVHALELQNSLPKKALVNNEVEKEK